MRSYDVAFASLAIDAPVKWTDNLLSQHQVPDVLARRRGVARRIPHSALVRLGIVRELHVSLGIGVREALAMASELLAGEGSAVLQRGHLTVSVDRAALARSLDLRLRDALESAPTPRRGRPPMRRPE
jgi:hypothetical protein